jgi:adenine-specific DNA-methyltransferase
MAARPRAQSSRLRFAAGLSLALFEAVGGVVRGFVETPTETVDLMVSRLFAGKAPSRNDSVLDPGCGTGAFICGVLRWCEKNGRHPPVIVGVESDPGHLATLRSKFNGLPFVRILHQDFLEADLGGFDFVIGNPPYVPITSLSAGEKEQYRRSFVTARGRFDLYLLFFERALRALKREGRLVFITPEKFLYVETAAPLRRMMARMWIEEIRLLDEGTFNGLVTYPTVTSVVNRTSEERTRTVLREGTVRYSALPRDGQSWMPAIWGDTADSDGVPLGSVCRRISCGVATGADEVFVCAARDLDYELRPFSLPTIAGRDLDPEKTELTSRYVMLIPYTREGCLLPEQRLGPLASYLKKARSRLLRRTCVAHKVWYAFHETPPLNDILRPKIMCKDISFRPHFWVDAEGLFVPRHSAYYIVPNEPALTSSLCDYLNSDAAYRWLHAHCQRAANGFLRLQSRILRQLPVPAGVLADSGKASRRFDKIRAYGAKRRSDPATLTFEFGR